MIENFINPVILQIGPFQLRWYGVLIMSGVALGAYMATRLARKRGLNPDHVWNALIIAVILAIVGARLYHVLSTPAGCLPGATEPCGWPYYKHHFLEAFNPFHGGFHGLGIYGAIAGGALGVLLYAWWQKLNPLVWLDLGAAGVALGQSIGRWGNFINQELYGPPTGSSWYGLRINPNLPNQPPPGGRYDLLYHPTFLYESVWDFLVFVVLYTVASRLPRRLRDGDIILGYIILYPLGRFFVEMFRPDAWKEGGLATAQWIAIACVVLGSTALVLRHVFWKRMPPDQPRSNQQTAETSVE